MFPWKALLLPPYYYATLPVRWRQHAERCRRRRAPILIVYYHRVADDRANEWTISCRAFRRHVDWMQRHFEFVSLAEAQRRIRAPANDRPCVAITFDDGYADNCHYALPLLASRRIPCTYFVCTHHVLHGAPFPHDLARGKAFAPNTLEQLRTLAQQGVEIGAHTRTHANLGAVRDPRQLLDEVVTASRELQDALGHRVRYFAFPYGLHEHLHPLAFALAREAGLEACCSAYGGYNSPGDDPFHLQRIGGEGPLVRLKNWLTVDPLKFRRIRRFEYQSHLPSAQPVSVP